MNDKTILTALETLGATYPWEPVGLSVSRTPEGDLSWIARAEGNRDLGMDYECGFGRDIQSAIDSLASMVKNRDPEQSRKLKIAELKATIEKLQSVVIGTPPYIPNRELAERNAIDIATITPPGFTPAGDNEPQNTEPGITGEYLRGKI